MLGRGRRVVKREVVVVVAPTVARLDGDARRLGITVSRRVGGAVVRNRLKRWVREWFRVARQSLVAGSDVLVIVRRPAVSLSVQAFRTVLDRSLAEVAR
ncbi:MAG: ribonuclease P protein component [bacterium]|nr:ribonuclease P protein component [bacterium]MDP7074116.1 ribonuclease P protein component [Myxococcota bacterium]